MSKGYVSYSTQTDPLFDDEGEEIGSESYILIDLVYVQPDFRGQGVARQLLAETLAMLKDQPLAVRLCALPKDKTTTLEGLISFYESMGFAAMDEQGGAGVAMEL